MPKPIRQACLSTLLPLLMLVWPGVGHSLELLTIQQLVLNCEYLDSAPDGPEGQYCLRYIQGFIDGAVETDERIIQDIESAARKETYTERAIRTRMPRRGDYDRPGSVAGFCLADPLQLGDVVDTVVADLVSLDTTETRNDPARVAVKDSLLRNYPCKR